MGRPCQENAQTVWRGSNCFVTKKKTLHALVAYGIRWQLKTGEWIMTRPRSTTPHLLHKPLSQSPTSLSVPTPTQQKSGRNLNDCGRFPTTLRSPNSPRVRCRESGAKWEWLN
ncbi:MAG: hypothetical protein IPL78_23290 [Chloroflexi bacterium]|nr:hypothetical protein [Chloroflexota bacterium]